jgi:hypothetical protein
MLPTWNLETHSEMRMPAHKLAQLLDLEFENPFLNAHGSAQAGTIIGRVIWKLNLKRACQRTSWHPIAGLHFKSTVSACTFTPIDQCCHLASILLHPVSEFGSYHNTPDFCFKMYSHIDRLHYNSGLGFQRCRLHCFIQIYCHIDRLHSDTE